MLAINYPNNPSGGTLSHAVLERLREIAQPGLVIFNDATYGPLVYAEKPRSILAAEFVAKKQSVALELHSFSKMYPIGPLSVSFLTGSADLLEHLGKYSEYAWSPLSRLQLATTAKCLQDKERIDKLVDRMPKQLHKLQSVLKDLGFMAHAARSGTYIICNSPRSIAGKAISSAHAAARLLMDDFDVAVVPLGTGQRSYLRFSSLYLEDHLERLATLRSKLKIL